MSMRPKRSKKHRDHGNPRVTVSDHEYTGNVCSGFGGELICNRISPETGMRCGLSSFQHVKESDVPLKDEDGKYQIL